MLQSKQGPAEEWIERRRVVAAAQTWERTPYHHMGRIKGAGVDCLTLLSEVFHEAGLIPKIEIPFYPQDWMHHRDAERYMEGLMKYAKEIDGDPQPGDIVLWKIGRCFSHAAIVVEWPIVIHACARTNVQLEDVLKSSELCYIGGNGDDAGRHRECKFFSFWAK